VLRLERWLNRVAIAAVVIYMVNGMQSLIPHGGGITYFLDWIKTNYLSVILLLVSTLLNCLITYLPLRALAYILKILMQMEFSSRGIGVKETSRSSQTLEV
jgi:hypothetical protein